MSNKTEVTLNEDETNCILETLKDYTKIIKFLSEEIDTITDKGIKDLEKLINKLENKKSS